MEKRKHIAASGKAEGTWVACNAQQKCRNTSIHVSENDLLFAQSHHETMVGSKTAKSKVPVTSVTAYLALPQNQKDVVIRSLLRKLKTQGAVIGGLPARYYNEPTAFTVAPATSFEESQEQSVADMSWVSGREKKALTFFSTENFEWINEALYARKKLPNVPGSTLDFGSGEIETEVVSFQENEVYSNPYVTAEKDRTRQALKEAVKVLDTALAKNPRKESRTLYRGVRNDIDGIPIADWVVRHGQPGQSVTFKGYQSTSLNYDVADETYADENGSIIFEITTHDGLNISSISSYPEEQEVLLPRNRSYTISSTENIVRESGKTAYLIRMVSDHSPENSNDKKAWFADFLKNFR